MHQKGDNNWMYENVNYGSSSAVSKNNFRQALRYNDYMMQNRNQPNLKNEQYSNYYNHCMSAQNNTAYGNNYSNYCNYSNYSYVNNQQGMQASQAVWGVQQTPYCLGPSCTNHSTPAAPTKPIQYSHDAYERASISHNMGRIENPVMSSLGHVSNYTPHYNHQSNYENAHLSNSKMIQNNKRFVTETSKIQVRNVFELNNTVCSQPDTTIAQRSNKPGQMNCFANYRPGQNQNQIISPIKQHENICSAHGNFNPMKPNDSIKSVTKVCQNMPMVNPVSMNRNSGYCCQNNATNSLSLTQQFSHNSNMVEKITRERSTFPEKIDMETAYRKKLSCIQEAVDPEKSKKALTFAIEQAKTQESTMTSTVLPKKSPSVQKNAKDLTDTEIEESVLFPKKSGLKSKTMMKALVARKTLIQEMQNSSNSQRMDEVEENTPEVITIKEEKEDWIPENSYTVETCVIENESINRNKDEDLYVIKSKFENKINKDKLTSLMGFLSHESFGNRRNIIIQNSEKDCSPTLESIQFENNNNNKRRLDDSILNHDRKKLTKKSSSGNVISLALAKTIEAEDIESLKSIVLKECGLENEIDFRLQSSTYEENESSLKGVDEESVEEKSTNIEQDNTDRSGKVIETESNPSPKEVIVEEEMETKTKKRRPSKRKSTDKVKGKGRESTENLEKSKMKDVGVQKMPDSEMCPACLSKSNEAASEEIEGVIKTMKAFQSLKHHKCMSCDLTCPSNTFWINVITGELRCLNCFKKMVRKAEEILNEGEKRVNKNKKTEIQSKFLNLVVTEK